MKIYRFVHEGRPAVGVAEGDVVARYTGADAVHRGMRLDEEARPLASLMLLTPVAPSKIVAVGRNYAEHAKELGNEAPSEPIIFLKPPSAVLPPNGTIVRPPQSQRVERKTSPVRHWEWTRTSTSLPSAMLPCTSATCVWWST